MHDSPISHVINISGGAVPSTFTASNSLGCGSGINWAKNLSAASKIPESAAPVSISDSSRPSVKVSNEVFERGAKLHSDFIVEIFYWKPPSYGKIWGVLNYLWGNDKRCLIPGFHLRVLSVEKLVIRTLCPRVYGPENKPRAYDPENKPRYNDKNRSSASPSALSQDSKKENTSHNEQKPSWKPVIPPSKNSSSTEGQSSASALVVLPDAKSSSGHSPSTVQKGNLLSDKAPMDLVVVKKSFHPPQKPLHPKPSTSPSSLITQTSNPLDILQEDSLALSFSDRPTKHANNDFPSSASKKKRKVTSSSVTVSQDDHPPLGVMHHTP
ncbi:unnamed protein product [Microthlaspi erraticum]|uniref:DUF4283 domain-containing protein n=1 Tax=Microthlaspi erraticum TaxID=1685480 RepID=A0A6D2IUF3_9BRAS|nr:unnamed protein product [Microthlaspi erraticum]